MKFSKIFKEEIPIGKKYISKMSSKGPGEMARWVKSLPPKHQELNSTDRSKRGRRNSTLGRWRLEPWGSLDSQVSQIQEF